MPFTQDHHDFRRVVHEFVANEINPKVPGWEEAGQIPLHEVFAQMAELGFLGLEYEPAYGGQGADHLFTAVLAEEFGRADHGSMAMALGVQVDMATPSLARFGTPEQKERFLAPALRGEAVAAIAVTEPGAGSDVAAIRTRASRDGDEWVINGSKTYITNSTQADWLCLLARTSEDSTGYAGMSQIIVPTATAGFEVSKKLDKLGMRASDTALLTFSDLRVPVTNTLGEPGRGFQQQMDQFVKERMWANYSTVGSLDRALQRTKEYTHQRNVFGKPLAASDFVAFKLAELAAEVDLLRHYNYAAAEAHIAGDDIMRFATIAKYKAGRLSREVADWCLQFHGGIGYMEETWTARFYRDTRLTGIGGGADEVMLDVLARLDGYRS
ncbi:MAG: acyl-CoA dehydrogenase family protein [Acidimicrobiia bacterium]|nr:acyl-CoA dehydrogenase family protein [Acidimicrobiia bacterium]